MKSAYVDASALVKLVLPEAETGALRAHLGQIGSIFTSEVAEIELLRAVRAASAEPDLHATAREWLELAAIVELDTELRLEAAQIGPTTLRTLDAIHLASATRVGGLIDELVTYDGRLAAAAVSAGFVVTSPSRLN